MASDEPFNCPNCGYALGEVLGRTRMADCPACGSTVYWHDNVLEKAGEAGEMHDAPLLVGLGDHLEVAGASLHLIGHARFSYGRGWWDEFWAEDGQGGGAWISIDEGEVILQRPLEAGRVDAVPQTLQVGDEVRLDRRIYRVTEREEAECVALRGGFPEVMTVGETYSFINCTGPEGEILSGEFWPGGALWFDGRWLDPFEMDRARRAGGTSH